MRGLRACLPCCAQQGDKGLRHFSMKVCEKVEQKVRTTYNEVADELVAEFGAHCSPPRPPPSPLSPSAGLRDGGLMKFVLGCEIWFNFGGLVCFFYEVGIIKSCLLSLRKLGLSS